MHQCPKCGATVKTSALLAARAPGGNFRRESMRFRLACPNCGQPIGLDRGTIRLFTVLWLCPLPLWAWVASWVFASGLVVLVLPITWFVFFPVFWLWRIRLTSLGTDQ
jgi:predicted RNA-binding Zn-ribbon protein involved in translation (DUF1610 family)